MTVTQAAMAAIYELLTRREALEKGTHDDAGVVEGDMGAVGADLVFGSGNDASHVSGAKNLALDQVIQQRSHEPDAGDCHSRR